MSGPQADSGDSGGDGQPSGMQRAEGAHASASAPATRKHLISRGVTMHSTHEETTPGSRERDESFPLLVRTLSRQKDRLDNVFHEQRHFKAFRNFYTFSGSS